MFVFDFLKTLKIDLVPLCTDVFNCTQPLTSPEKVKFSNSDEGGEGKYSDIGATRYNMVGWRGGW